MKNIILTSILLLLFTGQLFSQKKYSFGFEVSPTLNWISSDTKHVKGDGTGIGLKYGIIGNKYFADNYAVSLGVMFNHSAINMKYSDTIKFSTNDDEYNIDPEEKVTYNTQYVEFPLGLIFKSDPIGYTVITVEGGVIPGVVIKQKGTVESKNIDKENLSNETNLLNFSYYFEGGVEYSLGAKVSIKGSIFYSNGLLDVTNDDNHNEDKITINTLGLKVGVVF